MIFSETELELLDGMIGMNLVSMSRAATSSDIMDALDVGDLENFTKCMRNLINEDLVRKRYPESISDKIGYYVNISQFKKFIREVEGEAGSEGADKKTDWTAVKSNVSELAKIVEETNLSQADRAQAGSILASIKILLEAPEPPKRSIRALLHDLAAVATVLALALAIAGMIH